MLLEPVSADAREWRALVKPGRKLRAGAIVHFDSGFSAEVLSQGERGERTVRLSGSDDIYGEIERLGHMPLPPYIRRQDRVEDRERYQTVFARERGSVAAPTAGLHFTGQMLEQCEKAGARIARVTLHVGLGTFQSMDREDFENHQLHHERYSIGKDAWNEIQKAKRVVAVGTTSVRTVESAMASGRREGLTNLFIHPGPGGGDFRRVGAILTNFHLPRTSLLLLVSAFAGAEFTHGRVSACGRRNATGFFSYGDCMLIRLRNLLNRISAGLQQRNNLIGVIAAPGFECQIDHGLAQVDAVMRPVMHNIHHVGARARRSGQALYRARQAGPARSGADGSGGHL